MNAQASLNGQVTYDGDFARLHYQRQLSHSPERVWAAITDPAELKQWFMASSASIEPKVGGKVSSVAGPGQFHSHGKVITWDPPKVYEHEWITPPRTEIPNGENSVMRWELKPVKGGTLLTLEHRRLSRQTATGFGPGWHTFLDRMEAQLGGVALPEWGERFALVASGYPGWDKDGKWSQPNSG